MKLLRRGLKDIAYVEFRGLFRVRLVLDEHGRRRVVPKELADVLGLEWPALYRRMQAHFSKAMTLTPIPSPGGMQDTVTLDLEILPALLLGVEVSRVKPELRPRLDEIQRELTAALAAYVFRGVAVNPAFATPTGPKLLPAKVGDARELADKVEQQVRELGVGGPDGGEQLLAVTAALKSMLGDQDADAPIHPDVLAVTNVLAEHKRFVEILAAAAEQTGNTDKLRDLLAMGSDAQRAIRNAKAAQRKRRA